MSLRSYLVLIVGMGLVTYLPRFLPLFALTRRRLPQWLTDWLALIPVALLSALIAPILVSGGTPRHFEFGRPELWVALPTFLFAWKTRSLGGTVLVGMGLFWLAKLVM